MNIKPPKNDPALNTVDCKKLIFDFYLYYLSARASTEVQLVPRNIFSIIIIIPTWTC